MSCFLKRLPVTIKYRLVIFFIVPILFDLLNKKISLLNLSLTCTE